jgi:metal-responsive CopG/Arc/MetJ family transcriptional regulator
MQKKNLSDKAIKISLSIPESVYNQCKKIADERFGGNFSAFIQTLIDQYLRNQSAELPAATDPDALIKLFNQFLPSAELTASRWVTLHHLDQNIYISRLLLKLYELQLADLTPDQILKLMEWSGETNQPLLQVAEDR